MEIIKSNKNNEKVALKGYIYTKHKECKQVENTVEMYEK